MIISYFVYQFTYVFMKERERVMKWLVKFLKEDNGATAVEYAIMVAAIAGLIIDIVVSVGGKVTNTFTTLNTKMNSMVQQVGQTISLLFAKERD